MLAADHADIVARIEAKKAAEAKPPPPPLPAPEVTWRPATIAELSGCTGATRVAATAATNGWTVRSFFARGPLIGADGQPLDIADALTLMFFWGDRLEAWSTWYRRTDKKWEHSSAWIAGQLVRLNSITLGHWLTGVGPKEKK